MCLAGRRPIRDNHVIRPRSLIGQMWLLKSAQKIKQLGSGSQMGFFRFGFYGIVGIVGIKDINSSAGQSHRSAAAGGVMG